MSSNFLHWFQRPFSVLSSSCWHCGCHGVDLARCSQNLCTYRTLKNWAWYNTLVTDTGDMKTLASNDDSFADHQTIYSRISNPLTFSAHACIRGITMFLKFLLTVPTSHNFDSLSQRLLQLQEEKWHLCRECFSSELGIGYREILSWWRILAGQSIIKHIAMEASLQWLVVCYKSTAFSTES
jgi:hypothetical protein